MNVFKKSTRIIKGAAVTGAVAALTVVPTTAVFAHGDSSGSNGSHASKQTASAQHDKQRNDWFMKNHNRQHFTCQQRQAALNAQAAAVKDKDTKRLNGYNIISGGVQNYVTTNGITVANYDTMNAQVTTDQTNATNAVNAITAPQLNCDDQNSAAAVSDDNKTFKHDNDSMNGSINAAQQALSTYRKDLNTLFEAVINS